MNIESTSPPPPPPVAVKKTSLFGYRRIPRKPLTKHSISPIHALTRITAITTAAAAAATVTNTTHNNNNVNTNTARVATVTTLRTTFNATPTSPLSQTRVVSTSPTAAVIPNMIKEEQEKKAIRTMVEHFVKLDVFDSRRVNVNAMVNEAFVFVKALNRKSDPGTVRAVAVYVLIKSKPKTDRNIGKKAITQSMIRKAFNVQLPLIRDIAKLICKTCDVHYANKTGICELEYLPTSHRKVKQLKEEEEEKEEESDSESDDDSDDTIVKTEMTA